MGFRCFYVWVAAALSNSLANIYKNLSVKKRGSVGFSGVSVRSRRMIEENSLNYNLYRSMKI